MKEIDFGYAGNILRIDLSKNEIKIEATKKYSEEWLGGTAISQWILYNELKKDTNPLGPSNLLIFGTGPFNGTLVPTSSRITADTKNPITNGVGSSNAGGFFASELKYAGYDHIIIKGRAANPVYLYINDGDIILFDASHLWGKTTWEADNIIKNELQDHSFQIITIGPAGENLVKAACAMVNKNRALGRCGIGAVMGSKNLKAIAVKGMGQVRIAHPQAFIRAVDDIMKRYLQSKILAAGFADYGTKASIRGKNPKGGVPYKNFQSLQMPQELIEAYDPEEIKKFRIRKTSCMACPLACSEYFLVDKGPYHKFWTEGAQFEAFVSLGSKLAVKNPTFFIKANSLCNQYGIDVDLIGGTLAWAMECFEKGILKKNDFEGFDLEWGNEQVILEFIRKICLKEGIGNILAEGSMKAAEILGEDTKYYSMNTKGVELYEPIRYAVGWGLGVCVSPRGGGHTTGSPLSEHIAQTNRELALKNYGTKNYNKPLEYVGKAEYVTSMEILHRINNAFGFCHFGTAWRDAELPGIDDMANLFNLVTGREVSINKLKEVAVRLINVEKAFNLLHTDFSRKDDYPPLRCMEEPSPSGSNKGFRIEKEKYDKMLDRYYALHGWSVDTGFPKKNTLKKIGLDQIAHDLKEIGKLAN